ncbi:uncharacterized protein LOC126595004 [Malus sylvestris]|uniref:uncharacterized protein LOC126595004 n=1 Tax=Malus sylvestris TaxID=3752 RepID=UPI0021ACBCEB|nr:uncharacterized protein LOC126595004 [Malus sylvestris]
MKKLHLSPLKSTNPWDPTLSSNPIHLVTKTTTCWSVSPSSPATSAPENPPLDRMLLETTGCEDCELDENLESSVKLDSSITVVDAKNLRYQLSEHRISSSFAEAYLQIAFAVRLWIEEILWEKKHDMDVYRCKGVLRIHNSNQLHTLQGVSFCSSPHSNRVIQEFAYLHFSGLERIRRRIPCLIGLEVRYPR